MQKIIDGKIYNTNTAELIYTGYDNAKRQKRNYYMTSKGTYFCHYVSIGKIEIVSDEVMMDILAENDVDKFIELFGSVEEG